MPQMYREVNPSVRLIVCNMCGSVVAANESTKHDEWHEEQALGVAVKAAGSALVDAVKKKFEG